MEYYVTLLHGVFLLYRRRVCFELSVIYFYKQG